MWLEGSVSAMQLLGRCKRQVQQLPRCPAPISFGRAASGPHVLRHPGLVQLQGRKHV